MIELAKGALISLLGIEEGDDDIPFTGDVIVGANGVFKTSSSPVFEVVQPTDKVFSGFKVIKPYAKLTKRVPWDIFWQGPAWLKKQWDSRKNQEYIILLFFNPEEEKFFWYPPRQDGSTAHLDYSVSDDEDVRKFIEEGSMLAGTMHNHFGAKGTAFQSGTDSHDEAKSGATGIHWTMGYMDCKNLFNAEFHIRIVSGGYDTKLDMIDCVEDPAGLVIPEEWDKKLALKPVQSSYANHAGYPIYSPKGSGWTPVSGRINSFNAPTRSSGMVRTGTVARNVYGGESSSKKAESERGSPTKDTKDVGTNGESILGDITVLNTSCELSPVYDHFAEKFPKALELGCGEELIRSLALSKAMYEGAQYAIFTDEMEDDREDGLENIIRDLASGSAGVLASIKMFLEKQSAIKEVREEQESEQLKQLLITGED